MTPGGAPTELGTLSVKTLLRRFAIPAIIAMTASSLYNMIDSAFLGHIPGTGGLAIAGVTICFPLMNISTALGTLVGVGASTMISVLLGQKNYASANRVLANELSLNTLIGILFTLFTLLFMDPVLRLFGASDTVLPYARDYMTVIAIGNVVTHLYFGLNSVIRAEGNPRLAMKLTLFTVSSNALLDYLFIYPLGMGIRGAALATILCQLVALVYTLRFLSDKRRLLHFTRPLFQLDWRIARQSLAIGVGPFLMNVAACLVALFINQQLGKYGGDMAIGSYGILNRLTMLFVMICMGFNQGLQPIAGYNYGARQYHRVKEIFLLTAKWEVLVTTLCFLMAELIPRSAVSLFTNDPQLIDMAAHGLRIMNSAFALVGFGMVTGNFFQCLGMVWKSIFLSLSRQLLFLLPLIYTLPLWLQETGVWVSFPISDAINIIISAILIVRLFRKFDRLQDGENPDILGSTIQS